MFDPNCADAHLPGNPRSRIRRSIIHHNDLEGLRDLFHRRANAGQALANPKLPVMSWNDERKHTGLISHTTGSGPVTGAVTDDAVQNPFAPVRFFRHTLGMTLEMKQLSGVNSESALSSVEEHFLHTEGAAGSSPAARTIFPE